MRAKLIIALHDELNEETIRNFAVSDTEIGRYILAATDEKKRTQRLCAYLALKSVLGECGVELTDLGHGQRGEPVPIIKDNEGGNTCISISHNGTISAIAISDSPVGVDIEREIVGEREKKIDARFLSGRGIERAGRTGGKIEFLLVQLNSHGEMFVLDKDVLDGSFDENLDNTVYVNNNLHIYRCDPLGCTTSRWTSLESILKLSGGGFADFLNTGATAEHSNLVSYEIKVGGEHLYLTLAKGAS